MTAAPLRPATAPLIDSLSASADTAITLDLPPADTKRWVVRRKAQVVEGVRLGVITLEDACRRYNLSVEEFLSWQEMIDRHGPRGLRTTRIQDYRRAEQEPVG